MGGLGKGGGELLEQLAAIAVGGTGGGPCHRKTFVGGIYSRPSRGPSQRSRFREGRTNRQFFYDEGPRDCQGERGGLLTVTWGCPQMQSRTHDDSYRTKCDNNGYVSGCSFHVKGSGGDLQAGTCVGKKKRRGDGARVMQYSVPGVLLLLRLFRIGQSAMNSRKERRSKNISISGVVCVSFRLLCI